MQSRNFHRKQSRFKNAVLALLTLGTVSAATIALPIVPQRESTQRAALPAPQATAGDLRLSRTTESASPTDRLPQTNSAVGNPSSCGAITLTQNTNPNVLSNGTVACNDRDFVNAANSYARSFTMTETTLVKCIDFGVQLNNDVGAANVRVRLYSSPNAGTPVTANLNVIAEQQVTIPPNTNLEFFSATFSDTGIALSPGNYVIELHTPSRLVADGGDGGSVFLGSNALGQSAPTYIKAAGCNVNDYIDMASIGFPDVHIVIRMGVFTQAHNYNRQLRPEDVIWATTPDPDVFRLAILPVAVNGTSETLDLAMMASIIVNGSPWGVIGPVGPIGPIGPGGGGGSCGGTCPGPCPGYSSPIIQPPGFPTTVSPGRCDMFWHINTFFGCECYIPKSPAPGSYINEFFLPNPHTALIDIQLVPAPGSLPEVDNTDDSVTVSGPNVSEGVILCADGTPMSNCQVTANYYDSSGTYITNAFGTTDATGKFTMVFNCQGPNPGAYYVISASCCTQTWTVSSTSCFVDFGTLTCPCQPCDPNTSVVDPSFENNALQGYAAVLNNFTGLQGQWGAENGSIVTAENSVTPNSGSKMHRMNNDGLAVTQTVQVIDLTSHATQIDLGNMVADFSAMFNAHPNISAAQCQVLLRFYSGPSLSDAISNIGQSLVLDAHPGTWQKNTLSAPVPATTRWMVMELLFVNSTIGSNPGYVDDASLCIWNSSVPGPDCNVYWRGSQITVAAYDGTGQTLFDSTPGTHTSQIDFGPSPSPSVFWKESGLLKRGPANAAPTTPVIFGAAPCSTEYSLIAVSNTDMYLSCQQSVQIHKVAFNGSTSQLPITPVQLSTLRALAYHLNQNKLYIGRDGSSTGEIWTCDPNGGSYTHLVTIPPLNGVPAHIRGMDFDYPGNKIYVLGKYGNQLNPDRPFIISIHLTSLNIQTILLNTPGGSSPIGFLQNDQYDIAVDGCEGYMWWSCRNSAVAMEVRRATLTGASIITLATGNAAGNSVTVSRCSHPCPSPCPGDLTFDGLINANDLLLVINSWGPCAPGPCPADVTGDAIVNANDLLVVINSWGPCQ